MTFTSNPSYGRGEHTIDVDLIDGEDLIGALSDVFGSPDYRPPVLPAAALKVHELTRQREVDIDAVCEALETDALLAADVIRLAQSGTLARATPVRSVREAAMRLGSNALRDHVFRVALESRVFRSSHYQADMESVRAHSVAVGTVARRTIAMTAHSPEFAFLAGVLHDIGIAAGLLVLSEWREAGRRFDPAYAGPALLGIHESAGETIATLWKLPPELRWIIGAHHVGTISGYPHPIACACIVAESIVNDLGICIRIGEYEHDAVRPRALAVAKEQLGMSQADFAKLTEAAEKELCCEG